MNDRWQISGFQYLPVASWRCQINGVLCLASITLYLMYVMLCYVTCVQRCRKSREKMAMARLGQWLVWASFQLSMFTEQVFARAEHRALQTVIMQKGNWCCAQCCVVLCANQKVVCLVLLCEKQLCAEYAMLYTVHKVHKVRIALCACTKEVCTVCRAECACKKETLN